MLVEHVTRWVIYFIPYLTSLCPQTFRLISDVTEVSIPPDPTLAFLNIPVGIECFHTILRWYLIHYRLAKFYLNQSLVCWRGCDQVGNLLLHLTSFWCQTFQLIFRDTGVSISPDPTLALLNIGIECFPRILRWYLTHYRLVKFSLNQSLLCWRGCDQVDNLLHTTAN